MTDRSTSHDTFVIRREYDAAPDRVFAAWSEPAAKAEWFGAATFELDFRVGGTERNAGGPPGGPTYTFLATYVDIVPGQRIVYSYTMDQDGTRMSASVTKVEFASREGGTQLTFTEQGVYLDGLDDGETRRGGTEGILDGLGRHLGG